MRRIILKEEQFKIEKDWLKLCSALGMPETAEEIELDVVEAFTRIKAVHKLGRK